MMSSHSKFLYFLFCLKLIDNKYHAGWFCSIHQKKKKQAYFQLKNWRQLAKQMRLCAGLWWAVYSAATPTEQCLLLSLPMELLGTKDYYINEFYLCFIYWIWNKLILQQWLITILFKDKDETPTNKNRHLFLLQTQLNQSFAL